MPVFDRYLHCCADAPCVITYFPTKCLLKLQFAMFSQIIYLIFVLVQAQHTAYKCITKLYA